MLTVLFAFGLVAIGGNTHAMPVLIVGAVLLDAGVALNLILSQRVIYGLAADVRARLNGLFIAMFFVGGALGSALASFAYAFGGWPATCLTGAGFALFALCAFVTEFTSLRRLVWLKPSVSR